MWRHKVVPSFTSNPALVDPLFLSDRIEYYKVLVHSRIIHIHAKLTLPLQLPICRSLSWMKELVNIGGLRHKFAGCGLEDFNSLIVY